MSGFRRICWPLVLGLIVLVAACSTGEGDAGSEATQTSIGAASAEEPPPPDGIVALIEGYLASGEAQDEAALRAAVADGFIIHEYIYSADTGKKSEIIDDDVEGLVSDGLPYNWQNEIIGDLVVSGEGPWTVRFRELWQQAAERLDGLATYTVVDDGGTLKIARHSWAGFNWYDFE